MNKQHPSKLRFNFGFFLEAPLGTSRTYELAYPKIQVEELTLTPLNGTFTAVRTPEQMSSTFAPFLVGRLAKLSD